MMQQPPMMRQGQSQPMQPMLPTPIPQQAQSQPMLPQPSYPVWGVQPQLPMRGASPTAPDALDRPMLQRPPQGPQVAGFGAPTKGGLQPWMLVVGALVMAALAFAVTRAFISG